MPLQYDIIKERVRLNDGLHDRPTWHIRPMLFGDGKIAEYLPGNNCVPIYKGAILIVKLWHRIYHRGIFMFDLLQVVSVRLPQESGRQRGYGYAEFPDKASLIEALGMNDEVCFMSNFKSKIEIR